MATITFITASGRQVVASGVIGNLMEIARDHQVEGIEGDCGGVGSCATCHVRVGTEWARRIEPASDLEREVLRLVEGAGPESRLSCQIEVGERHDGLHVHVVS